MPDPNSLLAQLQEQTSRDDFRISIHAHEEMVEEEISLQDVLDAIGSGQMIEEYAQHKRGACCVVFGRTRKNRPIHIVCTSQRSPVIIITVYEPKPPKWVSPTQRAGRAL